MSPVQTGWKKYEQVLHTLCGTKENTGKQRIIARGCWADIQQHFRHRKKTAGGWWYMVFRKIVRVWNCWGTWLRCLPGQRGSWSLEAILSMGSMRKWGENNQIIHTLVKQIVETQHYRNVGCSQQTCSFASLWEFTCSHGLPVFFVDEKWQPTLSYWNGTSKESLPRMPGGLMPSKKSGQR